MADIPAQPNIISFPSACDAVQMQSFHDHWERWRRAQQPAPSAREQAAVRALRMIHEITGATQRRPYTALSQIDQIARQALA